jgi:ABC-type sugar transport system substrate-binding protein
MIAIQIGYGISQITANGPKNKKFLKKCMELGCIISVDNISEIEAILALTEGTGKRQKIILRIGGFDTQRSTRFGILKKLWQKSIQIIQSNSDSFEYLGYSFHVDILGVEPRINIFWESIEFLKMSKKL